MKFTKKQKIRIGLYRGGYPNHMREFEIDIPFNQLTLTDIRQLLASRNIDERVIGWVLLKETE